MCVLTRDSLANCALIIAVSITVIAGATEMELTRAAMIAASMATGVCDEAWTTPADSD
jgi:hypothetical protein